jgi:hypothetical protein
MIKGIRWEVLKVLLAELLRRELGVSILEHIQWGDKQQLLGIWRDPRTKHMCLSKGQRRIYCLIGNDVKDRKEEARGRRKSTLALALST